MRNQTPRFSALYLAVLLITATTPAANAQTYKPTWESLNKRPVPAWFQDARFGIFIHWGVYAVPSYAPVRPDGYSEWYWYSLLNKDRHSHDEIAAFHNRVYGEGFDYKNFEKQFKAELFDPKHWAKVFRESGAKYVVLTSKHHEGYCLWNSAQSANWNGVPWNAVVGTPKRDLLGDLTEAVRAEGLKMGYYYSLYEWYNPLYKNDVKAYVDTHMIPQFKDLVTRYRPSVIFSDGEWDHEDNVWRSPEILSWLFNESPVKDEVVVNDRWGKSTRGKHAATYFTSEYGSGMGPGVIWEESKGMGQSYGYNRAEQLKDYKTGNELVLDLVDIVSRGGNLLLDIGPAADGTIPVIMQERLGEIGQWLDINGEAIYGSRPWKITRSWSSGEKPQTNQGNYQSNYNVAELVRGSSGKARIEAFYTTKGNDLYVIIPKFQKSILIPGLTTTVRPSVLGSGMTVTTKKTKEGTVLVFPERPSSEIFVVRVPGSGRY